MLVHTSVQAARVPAARVFFRHPPCRTVRGEPRAARGHVAEVSGWTSKIFFQTHDRPATSKAGVSIKLEIQFFFGAYTYIIQLNILNCITAINGPDQPTMTLLI